ncbi:MAG TPA: hypothetical protein VF331_26635 [Polyangiales bacterium]
MSRTFKVGVVVVAFNAFAAGASLGTLLASPTVRADAPSALDRALVERLIRAEEAQASQLRELVSATRQRCR